MQEPRKADAAGGITIGIPHLPGRHPRLTIVAGGVNCNPMNTATLRLSKIFVRNVRRRMAELCISQQQLSDRIGCDKSHVSSLLSGRRHPGLSSLDAFAAALRTEPAELISENSAKTALTSR